MIFTAIATAIGLTGFFATAFVAIAEIATSIGLSYLARALAGKSAQGATSATFGMQGTIQAGGDVPRSFPIGPCATAGSLVYANYWGQSPNPNAQNGVTPNAYLTQVIALSDIPGCALTGIWVNGEKCTIGPWGAYGSTIPQYDKDGQSHLWVMFYDGTQTVADGLLTTQVSSQDRPWGQDRIGTGVAYAVVTALTEDTLFTGFPSFLFELQGIKLYDPSYDDTNGGVGPQRWSNPATWGGDGDNLPAVQLYNLLRGVSYNGQWLYGLQQMSAARLPAVNWIAQINKCRVLVGGQTGLEQSYRAGGQISVDQPVADAVDALLTTCQGKLSEVGGFYKVHLGPPESPSFAWTDDDILSTEIQTFAPFFGLAASINGVTSTYPDPTQGWQMVAAPPLYVPAYEAEDGNRRLLANPKLDFVPFPAQVQRLMRSALQEARRERQHSVVMPPAFWIVEPGDVGTWTSTRNGYINKQFRVDGTIDKANLDAAWTITEVDPTDYDWDQNNDFTSPNYGPTTLPRPAPQGVIDWYAAPATIQDTEGTARRPAIELSWDGTAPSVIGIQYEVRLATTQETITRGRTDQLAAGSLLISQNLLPNIPYEVRGQYLPSWPRDMLWSDWLPVVTPDVRFSLADFNAELQAQIKGIEQQDLEQINQTLNLITSLSANQDARNWNDQQRVRTQYSALFGSAQASIEEVRTVAVDTETAFAEFSTTITAQFGSVYAQVTQTMNAVATIEGQVAASYSLSLDANGYVIGYQLVNGGPGANEFTITADRFQIAFPGVNGGAKVPVFTVANVNGTPKIALRGDMYADGTITVNKLNVGTLSAITGNVGTLTAGMITGNSGMMVINLDAGTILIYGN